MRVLYVEANEDGTVGGSHRALFDLVRHLDRRRFEPRVLFYQSNPYEVKFQEHGVPVTCWEEVREQERGRPGIPARIVNQLAAVRCRLRYLRDHRIDLLHLNNRPLAGLWDWLPAARIAGVPAIAHCRSIPRAPDRRTGRWLWRRYAAYIPVSDHVAGELSAAGVDRSRIVRVYDGLDFEELPDRLARRPSDVRREFRVGPDQFMVAMVGHLHAWKGQDRVLGALSELSDDLLPRLRLVFVGEAPDSSRSYLHRLKRSVEENGLGGVVHFAGARDDALGIMNAADFVVHASTRPEPFGLVVLEAMACGRPVVASTLGGPSEIVSEGTGLLFDPAEEGALAHVIRRLIRSPDLRRRLAERAPERARTFSIEETTIGVSAVYESLLPTPAPSP